MEVQVFYFSTEHGTSFEEERTSTLSGVQESPCGEESPLHH